MSTSMDKDKALKFGTNVLIVIEVGEDPMDDEYDNGYIGEWNSSIFTVANEREVLFNVLSSFSIVSVEQEMTSQVGRTAIRLKYGTIP